MKPGFARVISGVVAALVALTLLGGTLPVSRAADNTNSRLFPVELLRKCWRDAHLPQVPDPIEYLKVHRIGLGARSGQGELATLGVVHESAAVGDGAVLSARDDQRCHFQKDRTLHPMEERSALGPPK